ncbi:MAG: tRNA glutamyl-Q(34) synthetase GluQRS [Pseudomonadota bacterium]
MTALAPVTRFAPSPTGPLHLGHAFSVLTAEARAGPNGRFLLRIEDIDQGRARPAWEQQIFDDLAWLGVTWETPVMRQTERKAAYETALDQLWARGLLYPCRCNRRDILAAASAPQEGAPPTGPDGVIYPGTCRGASRDGPRPQGKALRLDMGLAARDLRFTETCADAPGGAREVAITADTLRATLGDVVIARRDMGTSYHLAVVLDDAAQGVTEVTRGADLFAATGIQAVLQDLLDLPRPQYHHHRLIRDGAGKRLAKRDDARAIASYRRAGATPAGLRALLGL